jgi:hypothetical protein
VRGGRHDHFVDVGKQRLERLAVFGQLARQSGPHPAGFDVGLHPAPLDRRPVVGDPVDHLMADPAELVRGQVVAGHSWRA